MDSKDSLFGVLQTLYAFRFRLLSAMVLIGILAYLISLTKPDIYQSKTTFYAAGTEMLSPGSVFMANGQAISYFGGRSDRDRLMSIAQSQILADRIIDSFDLFTIYEIAEDEPKARENVRKIFSKSLNVTQTKFDAIEVIFEATDPQLSADVANAVMYFVDQLAVENLQTSQRKLLSTIQGSINQKQSYLSALADSMSGVQQASKVYDLKVQRQIIGREVAERQVWLAGDRAKLEAYRRIGYSNRDTIANLTARIAGFEKTLEELSGKATNPELDMVAFNSKGSLVEMLQQQFENTKNQLSYEIEKANHLTALLQENVTVIVPFEVALPPDTKDRPKRMKLVLTAMILTLIFGSLFLVLRHQFRDLRFSQEAHDGV